MVSIVDFFFNVYMIFRLGRGLFDKCKKIVLDKSRIHHYDLKAITYQAFDCINPKLRTEPFKIRYQYLRQSLESIIFNNSNLRIVYATECNNQDHLQKTLTEIIETGGEGLVLR